MAITRAVKGGVSQKLLKLDVLVIGAGITGLSAAIACTNKGYRVKCLESASAFKPIGAGLMISPNASRCLVDWGLRDAMDKVATASKRTLFKKWDGSAIVSDTKFDPVAMEKAEGAPNWQIHRADLHDTLLAKAKAIGIEIIMGARVKNFDWDAPSARLEDGREYKADVILAADGYRSRSRGEMLGGPSEPRSAGTSAFRCVVHREHFMGDPELEDLIADEKQTTVVWIGDGKHILAYPIRRGEFYNIVSTQPEVNTSAEDGKYVVPATAKEFQETFASWDPLLVKVLSKIPEDGILEWKLADLAPMDTWIFPTGKIALLGDACHAMLPSAAQGAGMGIEDGASVAEFLARAEDKSQIPLVLKSWEQMRLPRCTQVVNTGQAHAKKWHEDDPKEGEAKSYVGARAYDVVAEAKAFPLAT